MVEIETRDVLVEFEQDAHSIGALHGSARGDRNVTQRITAMERLAPVSGTRLLDIGCGTGEYTSFMANSFDQVDGIEIERERLELFRESAPENTSLHYMSANDLEFEDDTFDTITMIEVLEHLTNIPGALSEVARVLKPGGSFLLTTPSRRWPLEQHGVLFRGKRYPSITAPGLVWIKPLHRRMSDAGAFEPSDLRHLGEPAGLQLESHTFMMPPLDSLEEGHRAHGVADALEGYLGNHFGQTIVAKMVHS